MATYSRHLGRIRGPMWVASALLFIFGFLLQNMVGGCVKIVGHFSWIGQIQILNSHSLNTFILDIVQRAQGGEK